MNDRCTARPNDMIRGTGKQTMLGRLDYCRAMLCLHGFLSDGENEKIKQRIAEWRKRMENEA